ncbi:cytochrome P460 family protein [Paraburkholderia edwinii]|uniref:Cytochrome P460 family protein n=1 Tax=Paraburkholderia edwinii TaxID=2861782 RepID=A0ABX8UF48_9BURK|nr:cytochrome P460 family protein [Paraburkholderia edwinii]QYD67425.1 cytochrome P460 family protein [Paraburkholderia edwinii]
MKRIWTGLIATLLLSLASTTPSFAASNDTHAEAASPIYGVTIPHGYRKWQFVAPAEEADPLNELRIVLGNPAAMKALEKNTLPFPDGSILVKLAWKRVPSAEFAPASVPGAATTVQVMVKNSKRYRDSGGWGFGRFINGQPADLAQHQTCFACHQARVKNHDFVFTRLAP